MLAGILWCTGLVGLQDRVAALAGTLEVESPPGGGTVIVLALPVGDPSAAAR